MRHPEHITLPGYGVVFAAEDSSKAKYGLDCPEYLDSKDKDFLQEGEAFLGHLFRVFRLTHNTDDNRTVVEAEEFSGGFSEQMISNRWITWK